MGSNEKLLYNTMKVLVLVLVVVVSECIVPFGVLLLPLFLFNALVRWLAPLFNRKLGKMLTGMSALAASDDIYSQPLYTVLLYYFVDAPIDIQAHRRLFNSKVIQVKNPDGSPKYPELRQYIRTFCGYSFWEDDDHFSIDNHIKLYSNDMFNMTKGQVLNEDVLMSATNDILIKPFPEKRSPWEIMIFHGAHTKRCSTPQQSLVVFRYHHALSDGFSITKLMSNVTTGDYFSSPILFKEVPLWKRLLEVCLFPFTGMFVIVAYLKNYIDKNAWGFIVDFSAASKDKSRKIRDMVYVCSDLIPTDHIKKIKNAYGVSFNGIILSAIAGGIRKYFMVQSRTTGGVPDNMHVGLSFPVPGHPDQLTNHWTAAFIRLPTGVPSPHKRLQIIQKQFKKFETMLVSKMPYVGSIYGGTLFKQLINYILKNLLKGSTCSMSIFPGPENLQFLTGEKITSGGFLLGPLSNQGVSITAVSYNGALRVFFGIEKTLIPKEDHATDIVRYIAQEFDALPCK